MQEQLIEIYTKGYKSLQENKWEGEVIPTNPLLISLPQDYEKKLKVMFIAQETNDWHGEFGNSIEYEIEKYKNFWIDKSSPYSKKGPLMQTFNKLEKLFNTDEVVCIWNDIVKIGKAHGMGTPPDELIKWQEEWFGIVKKEIELLKPDLVIFFTGPDKYEEFIEDSLGKFSKKEIEGFKKRAFTKLEFQDLELNAYRTYHPNYLRRSGLAKKVVPFLEDVVEQLKQK